MICFKVVCFIGVTCRAPSNAIILGAPGTISPSDLSTLVAASMTNNYRGIMVWYASVKNGFQYGPGIYTITDVFLKVVN